MQLSPQQQERISSIVERFDFEKVLAYMKLVNWDGIYYLGDLKAEALDMLYELMQKPELEWVIKQELGLIALKKGNSPSLCFFIEYKAPVAAIKENS